MKYQTINGFTKDSMKAAIKAGNKGEVAAENNPLRRCSYLTQDGNKCAVGCFIPDGHAGQSSTQGVYELLDTHQDLRAFMPLSDKGLASMQIVHDHHPHYGDVREVLYSWIDKNVEDGA